jgi:hypothetical protein
MVWIRATTEVLTDLCDLVYTSLEKQKGQGGGIPALEQFVAMSNED